MSSWYAIEGERICRIQTVENRQHIDGTIRLTLPGFSHVVGQGGGLFEVHDEKEGGIYLAQALSCWHESGAIVLACTPLGEMVQAEEDCAGDDYFVVRGREPIKVLSYAYAQSQCEKGDHLRMDVLTADWHRLGCFLHGPCRCIECGRSVSSSSRTWDFRSVSSEPSRVVHPAGEMVMLAHRQRLSTTIDLARQGEAITTLIAHVRLRRGLSDASGTAREALA